MPMSQATIDVICIRMHVCNTPRLRCRWVKRTESWLSSDLILYLNYASVIAWAPLCSGTLLLSRYTS